VNIFTPRRFPFDRGATDLPAEYGQFQEQPGLRRVVLWDGAVAWLATRYGDVRSILADNRFSADASVKGYPALSESRAAYVKHEPKLFIRMDGIEHDRLRRMLAKEFGHARIQAMRPWIEQIVDELIDNMLGGPKPIDFYESFALPLPSIVI
jgi:cytochrome P450